MQYNLLNEPWIRVLKDNTEEKVSIRELFTNATKYKDILGIPEFQTSEYHLYRLMITIFCDAYRELLKTEEDVFYVMFDDGFDMDRMERYFAMCEAEGHSFDLLDTDRPFLQASREVFEKAKGLAKTVKASKVYNIVSTMPAEDSVIFAGDRTYATILNENNKEESVEFKLPLEDYAYWLIEKSCQSAADGGKLNTAIGGGIVTTVLIKGRNVFETIVLNAPPIPDSATVPMWRFEEFYPKEIDILSGMFTPNRIVYPAFESVDEEKKTISGVYLIKANSILGVGTKSKEFVPYAIIKDHWKTEYDPHVVLQKTTPKDRKKGAGPYKVAKFNPNRKGFVRICDVLGVTAADVEKVEEVGKLIFSKNLQWYSNRARDCYGAVEFAKICIYTTGFNHSLIVWTMKVGDDEFDLARFVTSPEISREVFEFAKACREVTKELLVVKQPDAAKNFDEESFLIFREFLIEVFNGASIEEASENMYRQTKIAARKSANMLLNTIQFNESYDKVKGTEMYGKVSCALQEAINTNLGKRKEKEKNAKREGKEIEREGEEVSR